MAWEIQGKVGPAGTPADGNTADLRLTRELGTVVGDGRGHFYESASRGTTFIACTAAAGIAPGTALTATGALMLANPTGSGKNLSILRAKMAYVSGTFGAGVIWWTSGINPASLPAETSAALRNCSFLNLTNSGDIAKAYSGVSLTNSPVIIRPSSFDLGTYAGTSTTILPPLDEIIDGELVVPPGFYVALEGIAASGTSPLVNLSITYEVVSP